MVRMRDERHKFYSPKPAGSFLHQMRKQLETKKGENSKIPEFLSFLIRDFFTTLKLQNKFLFLAGKNSYD